MAAQSAESVQSLALTRSYGWAEAKTALMMPVPLSYFSPAVGGLPGAAFIGFEPTYYWDTLTPGVLGWVNEQTARAVLLRSSAPPLPITI